MVSFLVADNKYFVNDLVESLDDLVWIVILTTVILLFFSDDSFVKTLSVGSDGVLCGFSLLYFLLFDLENQDGWSKEEPNSSLPLRGSKVEEHHVPDSQESLRVEIVAVETSH